MPLYKIFWVGMSVLVLVTLIVLGVWNYIAQQETGEVVEEELTTDTVLQQLSQQSPFKQDEVYFAEEGVPISGAELHEIYLEDMRRLVEFEFTLVPDILEQVMIPPPENTDVANLEAYQSVRADEEPPPFAGLELVPPDYEQSYVDIIYSSQYADSISDISFEVGILIADLARMYDRPALHERLPAVVIRTADPLPLPLDQNARTVYPNLRAGEAFFNYEFFSRLVPEFAEAYRTDAEFHAAYGQYHGLYGQSDVDATASVVRQYFDEYEALHGPLQEQFPGIISTLYNIQSL